MTSCQLLGISFEFIHFAEAHHFLSKQSQSQQISSNYLAKHWKRQQDCWDLRLWLPEHYSHIHNFLWEH